MRHRQFTRRVHTRQHFDLLQALESYQEEQQRKRQAERQAKLQAAADELARIIDEDHARYMGEGCPETEEVG